MNAAVSAAAAAVNVTPSGGTATGAAAIDGAAIDSVPPTAVPARAPTNDQPAPRHPFVDTARPLRVALMSFAHVHTAGYASLLLAMPNVELRASDPEGQHEPGERRGRDLADDLGVTYVDSYTELLEWQPDAVIVTSENARHRELVEAAARAGAAVLCEKPLATTLDDVLAMQAACDTAGVTLMTA